MKKSEIIESVAYSDVPESAQLKEHTVPELGFTVSKFSASDPAGSSGIHIILALILHEHLTKNLANLPEEPDAQMFRRLHEVILEFHQQQITAMTIPELEVQVVETHKKMIVRLQIICRGLAITYEQPEDPLLA
ncbi:MAG: hypothetical protein ABI430_04315 [Candidatus Taylorbacteria bacterium]